MADPKEVRPAVMFSSEQVAVEDNRPASPAEYYERYFKPSNKKTVVTTEEPAEDAKPSKG